MKKGDVIEIRGVKYEFLGWDAYFSWYPKRHKFMHQSAKIYIRDNNLKFVNGKWKKPILKILEFSNPSQSN
ncbi:MAG: hypothetical protein MUO72_09605 [Bacteroidales bacterium]|nr:hypothetical protein [Bacteroidales bacterium]